MGELDRRPVPARLRRCARADVGRTADCGGAGAAGFPSPLLTLDPRYGIRLWSAGPLSADHSQDPRSPAWAEQRTDRSGLMRNRGRVRVVAGGGDLLSFTEIIWSGHVPSGLEIHRKVFGLSLPSGAYCCRSVPAMSRGMPGRPTTYAAATSRPTALAIRARQRPNDLGI